MKDEDGPGAPFVHGQNVSQARAAAVRYGLAPASARHVLEVIAGYVNGKPAYPAYQRLSDETALSVPQVRKLIAQLVKAGYLAQSRRHLDRPGWDQPQWELGPLCNVLATEHFEGKVIATAHQSAPTRSLQSDHQRAQKRESVGSGRGVVQDNGGGKRTAAVKRGGEEGTPLPPKRVGNPRVQAFIDTLRAAGAAEVEAGLTDRHKDYIAAKVTDPAGLAQCMADLAAGRWRKGDVWIMERFSVPMVHQHRFAAWLKRDMADPAVNGRPLRGLAAVRARHAAVEVDTHHPL